MLRKAMVVAGLFTAGLALAGASHSGMMNMIDTKNASIDGESIVFPMVKAAKKGYLVIHAVKDGQVVAPASIGHTPVNAGENANVAVKVAGGASRGTDYVAMLHDETNGNGTYDFGAGSTTADPPSMEADKAVAMKFMIAK